MTGLIRSESEKWFSNNGSGSFDRYVSLGIDKAASISKSNNYMNTNGVGWGVKEKERGMREREIRVYFTIPGDDPEGHCVARFFD